MAPARNEGGWRAACIGLLIGLALIKLGNPVTLDSVVAPPNGAFEILVLSWPMPWGFFFLIPALAIGLAGAQFRLPEPRWVIWLLFGWFGWALFSSARTIDPKLTGVTLVHFAAVISLFFLGLWGMGRGKTSSFWITFIPCLFFVLWLGMDQHYGGLEATRKMFYENPNWQSFPKEYIARINSHRIFSTLVYPNALAGVILLWLPASTLALWEILGRFPQMARMVAVGSFAYIGLACFYWTGSKAGWLIALAVTGFAVLHAPMKRNIRIGIVVWVTALGLAAFTYKYRDYFARGATSASARFIYWQAAAQIAVERPILGSGPGTFGQLFKKMKPPEAEMARLVHNDYLQQASDSGWPAFLAFASFVVSGLALSYRTARGSPVQFALWLGLLGWALQSIVEFGLYIPAISWSAFLLVGWLLSQRIPSTTQPRPNSVRA